MTTNRPDFPQLRDFYRDHLLNQVVPFWMKHCIDREYGGVLNCVADDGTLLSTDKYLWSQGRALWTFAALCRHIEPRDEWMQVAHKTAEFLMNKGPEADGKWAYCWTREGKTKTLPQSIYIDGFVIYGLTEYARLTGSPRATEMAVAAFEQTSPLLDDHSTLDTEPHKIPDGVQSHGPSMMFAYTYHDLGMLTGDKRILNRSLELAEIVMTQHLKPQDKQLYEFVTPGGQKVDSDVGKTFLAGHVVESMWFMEHIYRHHNMPERIDLAMQAIRWHLEKGWDNEYGGLFLASHCDGGQPVWHQPDAKAWWPHTESLYACLLAYRNTHEDWCMDWYWRVHDYAFEHFVNKEDGEWHQSLDRQGRPTAPILKNLQVKDPYHLVRALLFSMEVMDELSAS